MTVAGSEWELLLRLALPALDHVFPVQRLVDGPSWTLGGGTAIMLQIGHRVSHDIDIFVPGTRLKVLTPALNPAAKLISDRFQWPGHYLKFERSEGEIDFLSAPLQTDPGYVWRNHIGRTIAVETPEEVIVKKVRYRGDRFTARDAFDLAAVAQARPGLEAVLAAEVGDVLPRLAEAIRVLQRRGVDALRAAVIPLGDFSTLVPHAISQAADTVARASAL